MVVARDLKPELTSMMHILAYPIDTVTQGLSIQCQC